MQSVASHLELDEVVSPELVLVDPELAQIARRRLREAPEWRPQTSPHAAAPLTSPVRPPIALSAPPAVVRHAPTRHGPRAATSRVVGAVPLFLLGALVFAMVVSEVRAEFHDPVASLDPAPVASHAPPPASRLPTTREVEVRTLALLADGSIAAPAALLDDRLGRLANNVWIACRRIAQTARFTCKLGAGTSSARAVFLNVVVANDGSEVLTWEPTRMAR